MAFFSNLLASIRIAFDNLMFYHGTWVRWSLWLILAAFLLVFLLRPFFVGKMPRTSSSSRFKLKKPDGRIAERAAKSLSDAIRFKTVTGNAAEFAALRQYLRGRYPLVHKSMQCEIHGGSLLYRWKSNNPDKNGIMLCAHMDVVPADEGWQYPPFSGEITDTHVWGRGALDCKGPLVSILEAAENLLSAGFSPIRDIYLAFGHDEETGGKEGAAGIAGLLKDRGVRLDFVLDEGGCISVGFPENQASALVGLSEKGVLNLKIAASGEGGHAASPPKHTALGTISEVICRLENYPMKCRLTPLVKKYLKQSLPGQGYFRRLLITGMPITTPLVLRWMSKKPETAALLRTTLAATMASASPVPNVLPKSAEAFFSVRLLHGDTEESVISHIAPMIADLPAAITVAGYFPPAHISDDTSGLYTTLKNAVAERFGDILVLPSLVCGSCDAKHYDSLSDSVFRFLPFALTPRSCARMHGANERVEIDVLGAAVEFYMALIRRITSAG